MRMHSRLPFAWGGTSRATEAMIDHRIVNITLDERMGARRNPEVEHERAVAIYDLLEDNHFAPHGDFIGPFVLHLGIVENTRLVFEVYDRTASEQLCSIVLPLVPFRKLVKDYFLVCESYYEAIRTASPSQIEAIDMGRRGLHNEGAELLRERLSGKIEVDHDTSRRLFTLLCVLHVRG